MQPSAKTSATLLERLHDERDQDAWERFTMFYQPLIYQYALSCRCSEAMAWDIVQETLVDLLSIMSDFDYDPEKGRFRDFLYRIVKNRVLCAFRREKRYVNAEDVEAYGRISAGESRVQSSLPEDWQRHWQRQLLKMGLSVLKERVKPRTYEAFHAYVIQEQAVDDVCNDYDLTPNALYQIRHRTTDLLKDIVRDLERDLEGTHD